MIIDTFDPKTEDILKIWKKEDAVPVDACIAAFSNEILAYVLETQECTLIGNLYSSNGANPVYGFEYKGVVYAVKTTDVVMPYVLKLDKASRGAGYSLRFKPTNAQKVLLIAKGAEVVCSIEYFNEVVADTKYNKGEVFEKPEFIGPEVTGDRRFYNSNLRMMPFTIWRNTLPEEYR